MVIELHAEAESVTRIIQPVYHKFQQVVELARLTMLEHTSSDLVENLKKKVEVWEETAYTVKIF